MIVPEVDYNLGWADSKQNFTLLGKQSTSRSRLPPTLQCYAETTKIHRLLVTKLPARMVDTVKAVNPRIDEENHYFLSRSLVGTFNDHFNYSPNHEMIQKWFMNRWKICEGMKVTPMSHNQFLFELPSRKEAARDMLETDSVTVDDCHWSGSRRWRALS